MRAVRRYIIGQWPSRDVLVTFLLSVAVFLGMVAAVILLGDPVAP
jgi:hypothetical protein